MVILYHYYVDCKSDRLWVRLSKGNEIFDILIFSLSNKSVALSSATQHAMPPEFSGKWGVVSQHLQHTLLLAEKKSSLTLFMGKRIHNVKADYENWVTGIMLFNTYCFVIICKYFYILYL